MHNIHVKYSFTFFLLFIWTDVGRPEHSRIQERKFSQ